MNRISAIIFTVIVLITSFSATAKVVNGYTNVAGKSTGLITFKITSIDYRTDLTRLSGVIAGRPHTSNRIDELVLITPGGIRLNATDIDGVDMKRYFQWEDNGEIEVEIDFPPIKPMKSFTLKTSGPNGESQSVIIQNNKPTDKHKK